MKQIIELAGGDSYYLHLTNTDADAEKLGSLPQDTPTVNSELEFEPKQSSSRVHALTTTVSHLSQVFF